MREGEGEEGVMWKRVFKADAMVTGRKLRELI